MLGGLLLPGVSVHEEGLAEALAVQYQIYLALVDFIKHLTDGL